MLVGIEVFQTIIVIFCFLYFGLVLALPENKFTKLMTLISILALVMNIGCLMELYCKSEEAGFLATRVKYMGAVYLATCFYTFIRRYLNRRIHLWVHLVLITWDTFIFGMLCTNPYHHLFFADIYYAADAAIPTIVKEKAVFFYIYMASNVLQMLACVVVTLKVAIITKKKRKRDNALRLMFCTLTPLILYFLSLIPALQGFDLLPASVSIAMFIMMYGMVVRKDFLISEVAHGIVLDNLQEPVVVYDTNYEVAEKNAAVTEEILAMPMDFLQRVIDESSMEYEMNDRIYQVRGKEMYVKERLVGYIFNWVDLTEQKQQIKRMEELKNEADRANRVKSEFLANVSHDIRTPLNAILGLNDVVIKETDQQEIRGYATDIARSSKLLLALVNDILDLAKIEANKLEIVPTDYVLRTILDDLFNMHSISAREKGLRLDFVIDPFLPAVLHGDDIRIQQVMSNLLANAIKYTNHGSVTVKVSGKRDAKDILLRVEVKDTGLGISQDDLPQIKEKFTRVYEASNRYEEGSGLGLGIAVRLLRLMGSELEIESIYGEGSTFSFTIRQEVMDETDVFAYEEKAEEPATVDDDFLLPSAKILSVDDNEINLKLFRLLMKPLSCELDCVTSGQDALEITKQKKYDLIFLDHMMPEMDGLETRDRLLADTENPNINTPIVMLTANAINGAKEEYLDMGFDDYLMKPIDIPSLKAILCKYLPEKIVKRK